MDEIIRETEINEIKTELITVTKEDSHKNTEATTALPKPSEAAFAISRPEEVSNNVSGMGDEIVIFAESIENSPQAQTIKSYLHAVVIQTSFVILGLMLVSLSILSMYVRGVPDISFVMLSLAIYHVAQFVLSIYSMVKNVQQRRELKRMIIGACSAFGYIVSYTAFFLYFLGSISSKLLLVLLVPNALVQIFRYTCFNHLDDGIFSMPFFCLAESMTFIMFALKLDDPESPAVWSFVLLWYHIVYYFCISFIIIIIAAAIIYGSFLIFQPEMFDDTDRFKLIWVPIIGLLLIGFLVAVCSLFTGFRHFLDLNLIHPHPSKVRELPTFLKGAAIYSLVVVAIVLIAILVVLYHTDSIIRKFIRLEGKVISLKSYINNLTLKIKRVGGNYFVKSNRANEQPSLDRIADPNNANEIDRCTVCYDKPSTVLLDPCRHCIFCEECIKDYLKTNDKCPLCRGVIEKGFIIFYDEEKRCYVTNKSIKVKVEEAE
jgi:hypothetical protein